MPASRQRLFYFIFFALLAAVSLVIAETGARLMFRFKTQISKRVDPNYLDVYEMVDPREPRNWVLRPSTRWAFKDLDKRRALTHSRLEKISRKYGLGPEDVLFEVNSAGFKGPEIRAAHDLPRILTIGDSCTFGTVIDKFTYARSMEAALQAKGRPVEVINGGVKGYTPTNVMYRIEEFKNLKPDLTTVYLGWNVLYTFDAIRAHRWLHSPLLLKSAWIRLQWALRGRQAVANESYYRAKNLDKSDSDLGSIGPYKREFLRELETIATTMRASGSRVVIVTLPALFLPGEWPSDHALEIGHMPEYTNNPLVFARLTEEYNQAVRELARAAGFTLVDLNAWARQNLRPTDEYFLDSLHLTEEGQQKIGQYMAEQIAPLLRAQ